MIIKRREFLTGLLASTLIPTAFAQSRKEVFINGKRIKTVDIHAHASIKEVERVIAGTSVDRTIGGARLLDSGRLDMMDAWGIDVSVISANQYWWYAAQDVALAREIIRVQDEGFAEWVSRYPDRFVALTSVAMQFPELAAEQLDYAVNELGFRGASMGGHVNGEVPSGPAYDVFWAKAQELDVPIFIHPNGSSNIIQDGGLDFAGDLGNIIGNPLETTLFLTQLMFDGTFDRFPGLKICGAHGGGYLPSYFGRAEVACSAFGGPAVNGEGEFVGVDPIQADDCKNQKPPREYLKTQIFADTMVFSDEALRHLVAEMGSSQVVYGTDMPLGWPDTMDTILNSVHLTNADKEAILGGNLIRLLKLNREV
ncbi:MAG: amidohydrolase family protein [Proteobacteria bacterium]|jgi:aminocarboxymuconate-semialdehyde decarboxylase|nr:amidohydrolase family protein [Pseudomonadota bacterium]